MNHLAKLVRRVSKVHFPKLKSRIFLTIFHLCYAVSPLPEASIFALSQLRASGWESYTTDSQVNMDGLEFILGKHGREPGPPESCWSSTISSMITSPKSWFATGFSWSGSSSLRGYTSCYEQPGWGLRHAKCCACGGKTL